VLFELEAAAVQAGMLDDLVELVHRAVPGLWTKLTGEGSYCEQSGGDGWHGFYLIEDDGSPMPGSTKLAREPREPTEDDPSKVRTLIETKAEDGFAIVAPSGGRTHPKGGSWRMYGHCRPGVLPTLTREEHDALMECARALDRMPPESPREPRAPRPVAPGEVRPGDAYNEQADWADLLEPKGWTQVYTDRRGVTHWRRPGKRHGTSATIGHGGDWLHVFSTSTDLPANKSMDKFRVYAELHHGGDLSKAAAELARQGYGSPPPGRPAPKGISGPDSTDSEPPPISAGTAERGSRGEKPPSQATVLAALALEGYDFRADDTGTVYALPKTGPRIVRPLRGGAASLRAELAKLHRRRTGKVPTQAALTDAIASLEGEAIEADPVDLHLRVAQTDETLWLDLGDPTGRAVRIAADGWTVVDAAPVWFRRTELTGALPEPVPGGDLGELWDLVNIDKDDRPLVLALLVATLLPGIPHPIAFLLAEQGSGKSTAAKVLAGLIDPSPVPLRKPPRDEEAWITAAAGSHVVAVDNVSRITEWWSDSLCRAATGDGDVRRRLYTDADLTVFAFRRVVWLTGIDITDIRDDLADRAVMLVLRKIERRRTDDEIARTWGDAHPRLLGALLDLAVRVLAELPSVPTEDLPRMADFGRVLRAVDAVLDTTAAERYAGMVADMASELADADPLAETLRQVIRAMVGPLTSAELLTMLDRTWGLDRPRPREWPATAKALAGRLTRIKPTLERLGWKVIKHERGGKVVALRWTLIPPAGREE
jgi:energy-coupling factor transporter ATP-binding protein EcfA2